MEKRMGFMIVGKSPLMTNNPQAMQKPQDVKSTKGKKIMPSPEEDAKERVYIDSGKFCFPSIGVRNSIIKAAGDWKPLTGKKKGTLTSQVAHIKIEPELIPILMNGKPSKNYEIDLRRVVIRAAGGSGIIRARPKFNEWEMKFEIIYDDDFLAMEEKNIRQMFTDLLNDAGKRIGIGDYRPSKTGWFGTFGCSD